jgi:pyridinium-3,5-bisthiocarboxylic acid mononucleotide nickel chelatase
MRIAYLDCFSGISGDMFLGALVDAGVSPQLLEQTVAALDIGARLEISRVTRGGISATKVDVFVHGEKDEPREVHLAKKAKKHKHEHHHHHPNAHTHRGLKEIRQIIEHSAISATAKKAALRIFQSLGEAEAKIHNRSIDQVHFHEVGAVDAMVDIVCAAVGAESLSVDEFIASPLNVGGGRIKCAHGVLPVPAPATVELLKDAPIYSSGIQAELVTPTGAAIVKTLATRFASFPAMTIHRAGYGAGTRELPDQPNVLRLTIGEARISLKPNEPHETITVLEANLDDLNPQIIGFITEQLLERGALDVFTIPAQMKKNRPGTLLTVLCRPEQASTLTDLIFRETTTLGVRSREEHRQVLDRHWQSVPTHWGAVRIKIASRNGAIANAVPEYEDCRRIAAAHDIPLKTVIQEAMQRYGQGGRPRPSPATKRKSS